MLAGQIQVRPGATADRWWRRLCPGSFVLAGLTALVVWVAVAELLRQGRLGEVLSAGRAELAAPLLVALVVGTGICERFWPAERRPVLARGHVQDACFLALHAIVVIPLMTMLSVGAATLIGGHAHWLELRATEQWPGWLLVPLTIVAMDGANWLAHYADHRLGPLWRFHALHHSQRGAERPDVIPCAPSHAHDWVSSGDCPGRGPDADASDGPGANHDLRMYRHFPARQSPLDLRPGRPRAREPCIPPASPCAGHSARQPRRRPDDLGHPGRLCEVPFRSDAVGRTGLDGRPIPVEQDDSAG